MKSLRKSDTDLGKHPVSPVTSSRSSHDVTVKSMEEIGHVVLNQLDVPLSARRFYNSVILWVLNLCWWMPSDWGFTSLRSIQWTIFISMFTHFHIWRTPLPRNILSDLGITAIRKVWLGLLKFNKPYRSWNEENALVCCPANGAHVIFLPNSRDESMLLGWTIALRQFVFNRHLFSWVGYIKIRCRTSTHQKNA